MERESVFASTCRPAALSSSNVMSKPKEHRLSHYQVKVKLETLNNQIDLSQHPKKDQIGQFLSLYDAINDYLNPKVDNHNDAD